MLTDEVNFHVIGYVEHNFRYWTPNNPQEMLAVYSEKVFGAIWNDGSTRPILFWNILQSVLIPLYWGMPFINAWDDVQKKCQCQLVLTRWSHGTYVLIRLGTLKEFYHVTWFHVLVTFLDLKDHSPDSLDKVKGQFEV